jgi:hypothetical protein
VWHEVFPEATAVHIYRDGREVARSLYVRDVSEVWGAGPPTERERVEQFHRDLALWEVYERRIRESLPRFGSRHAIRYERLVASPREEMAALLEALRIPAGRAAVALAAGIVDSGRTARDDSERFRWMDGLGAGSALLAELGYV